MGYARYRIMHVTLAPVDLAYQARSGWRESPSHSDPMSLLKERAFRLTDKRYARDNRLMALESSYRQGRLAPRCRLITSWLWRGFQGFVCSPIKVVRELGLDRRETGRSLSAAARENVGLCGRTRGAHANWRWWGSCILLCMLLS